MSYFMSLDLSILKNTSFFSDYNEFLDDLEEDPALRQNVNIFKSNIAIDSNDPNFDPTMPQISLEEMLDDLTIDDVEMEDMENTT